MNPAFLPFDFMVAGLLGALNARFGFLYLLLIGAAKAFG